MATRGRTYAENLVGTLDRSGYQKQRDAITQAYNTNWQNIQNQYKNLTDKIKRQQEQANEDFANGLVQVASDSFDRMSQSNQDMANKGLTLSGIGNLMVQSDTQMKGDEIGKLLKSVGATMSEGAEKLKDANQKIASQENELNKGYGSSLGDVGDSETAAQNAFNNALADIAEAMEARQDNNDLAAKQRAASRSGRSGTSKEEEELNEFYKKMAITEILSSEDMTDRQKSNSLAILFGTKNSDRVVDAFNKNSTATKTRNKAIKSAKSAATKEFNDALKERQRNVNLMNLYTGNAYKNLLFGNSNNLNPDRYYKNLEEQNKARTEYVNNAINKVEPLSYEDLAKMLYG